MRKCQVISTVSNGAYRFRDIASRTINTLFNRATQDDPRPALAVKKRIQCTAPTPWQLSTLTHLLTPNLQKRTGPHTNSLQHDLTAFTSHDPSTGLCPPVLHALAPKRCVSICCHHQRLPIQAVLFHWEQVPKVVAAY